MIEVCYIVDALYAGGAERYVALLAGALDRGRFAPSVLMKKSAAMETWRREMQARGIPVTEIDMNLPFRPLDAFTVFAALGRLRPDIVHVNIPGPYDGQMGLAAPLARFAGASGVVVTEHLPMVERLAKRAFVKGIAYRWVDRLLTVCRANVPYLIERQKVPAGKIEVVHNALPAGFGRAKDVDRGSAREHYGLMPGCAGIAFVGALSERKGLPVLLRALQLLETKGWRLLVAGDGEERGRYEQAALDMGLGERVRFLGNVPEREVERLLGAVDMLVLPSYMEAMPYVILEAMACALPVVASAIYGITETAVDGETGILVPAGDSERLSGALRALLADDALRRRMGENARKRFEKYFTLDRQIDRIQAVYLQLAGIDTRREWKR
jgi:glycosyltransferase involved in cell wall biosynthesis